jgi:hypothetical protein
MEEIRFLFGRYATFRSRCGEMDGRCPIWVMGLGVSCTAAILSSSCRLGSKADIGGCPRNVRFTPKSGHWLSVSTCPLCAKSRHWHRL